MERALTEGLVCLRGVVFMRASRTEDHGFFELLNHTPPWAHGHFLKYSSSSGLLQHF